MSPTEPLAVFPRSSQVILGTTIHHDADPEGFISAKIRQRPLRNNVTYLAGRKARDSLIVQASFDQLCILSRDQRFDQALPFWDAFSGSQNADQCVTCTAVGLNADLDQILLAAAMDHRIAVWYATASSSTRSRKWKVHSTLTIKDGVITTLDIVNGQLLTGTTTSLSLWRLDSSDIPIWKRFWTKNVPAPIDIAKLSPDATNIAAIAEGGQNILLWQYQPKASKPPILQQRLYHARAVTDFFWRQPPEKNSQGDVLISYASDGVARIWAPVIDEPTQLRLCCSVENPRSAAGPSSAADTLIPAAYYLDPHILCAALRMNVSILHREIQMAELGVGSSAELDAHTLEMEMDLKRTRLRRLEQLANETPDMFVSFDAGGFDTLTAVANIDRRPPTLLQALTVLRIPFALPEEADAISAVNALPLHVASDSLSTAPMLTLHLQFKSGSSTTYAINPATFFDGRGLGIDADTCHPCGPPPLTEAPAGRIRRHTGRVESLQRSGDGKVLVSSSARETVVWTSKSQLHGKEMLRSAKLATLSWDGALTASLYSGEAGELRRAADGATTRFDCEGDAVHVALTLLNGLDILIVVTSSGVVHSWAVHAKQDLSLSPRSTKQLWTEGQTDHRLSTAHSISGSSGQPGNDLALVTTDASDQVVVGAVTVQSSGELRWSLAASFRDLSGSPHVARINVNGLVAVIYRCDQGKQTLVIYNSKTTSFTSGEEYRQVVESKDQILALDWSPSPLSCNALSLVFQHHVDIIAPGRFSSNENTDGNARPRWEHLVRLDLRSCTPSSIRAACWLGAEQVVISSGSVLFVYGPWVRSSFRNATKPRDTHLSELIAEVGGPVVQYHPAFLLQCAIWRKIGLAKAIISNLEKAALACDANDVAETWMYEEIPLNIVLQEDVLDNVGPGPMVPRQGTARRSIFDEPGNSDDEEDKEPFPSERIDKLAHRLQDIHPPHLSLADLRVLISLIKTIGEAVREHRSLDASGLRYMLALRQMLNGKEESKQADGESDLRLSFRDHLWAFHSENQETLLAAVDATYRNNLDWPAARSTGIFTWLKNPQALRTHAEAVARAQFMIGEDRDPVKCSLLYFALGKRKVVQGLWRQAVWHPEQKKMLQFLSHDFDEERWKTAAQKNAFALLSQRRYEFAASFFMLGESLKDAVNVCVRNLDDLPLAIALARVKGGDDGPVFVDLLKTRILPLAFERGDRWMGSWAFWMLKRRDLAVRIIVTPLRDLIADDSVADLLGWNVTCGNDSYNDPALALLFQQLRSKSLQTIKGLYDIPEKRVFDFVLNANRALCRMGCHSIGLSLLRNWQFESTSVSSASTNFHQVSKHDLQTLSRVDEAVLPESPDAFRGLRFTDNSGGQDEAGLNSPTQLRRRTSQSTMSPPSSPREIRRRSSLLRRRSSIINDLDIGTATFAAGTTQKVGSSNDGVSKSQSEGTEKPSVEQAKQTHLAAEPASVKGAESQDEKSKMTNVAGPKKQGISIFKGAAASNSQQGAQEFDFGSFGF
ncbi:related to RAV1 - Regulator of (H+)-ATPase in vacuolar membrane [Melanopsichium pennsylvanicum]|uniref:Related to RAV1 - Regulator of (H+)-ATPase in vacuolar membrane n=2 Tax=Melanopsichium pennsylvanicum TaxID=63383 RepID=A0AAJ5C4Y2_9BASI|nr:related to RAV1 - Regulator of (H+)-ATPase in vacuolar membrane [Melanopsichium pennsylvanicum]